MRQPPKPTPPRPYLLNEWHGPHGPKGYINDDGSIEWVYPPHRAFTRWLLLGIEIACSMAVGALLYEQRIVEAIGMWFVAFFVYAIKRMFFAAAEAENAKRLAEAKGGSNDDGSFKVWEAK
jgi:hypothetical protein